jgi:O-antigen ligase
VAAPVAISSVSKAPASRAIQPGALVLALALPLLFLHRAWQPSVTISTAELTLSDAAVAAIVVAAIVSGVREGFAPLRAGRLVWITWAFFLFWLAVATAYGAMRFGAYPAKKHVVTLAKWDEYALLAPALPLLLRRRTDLQVLLWSLALWSAAATLVGVLEWFGLDVAAKGAFGKRQASFLGTSDFAALSGAALLAGFTVRRGPLGWLLVVSGVVGSIVAGSIAALLGLATATGLAVLLLLRIDRRRAATIAGLLAVVAVGSIAIRTADLTAFQRFLGGKPDTAQPNKVQTYAHRTTLAYIGGRIWLDHPLLGVGWEGSKDAWAYMPYVPDAKRRFPHEAPLAFPTPTRSYGIQLMYLEALADLGVVGFLAVVALFVATLVTAARARVNAAGAIAGLWILFVIWCWTAQDFVAGIPLDALTWLTVGLAATAAAWRRVDA